MKMKFWVKGGSIEPTNPSESALGFTVLMRRQSAHVSKIYLCMVRGAVLYISEMFYDTHLILIILFILHIFILL